MYASSAHIDSCFSAVISMSSMDVYRVAREGKRSADLALINGPWAADAGCHSGQSHLVTQALQDDPSLINKKDPVRQAEERRCGDTP